MPDFRSTCRRLCRCLLLLVLPGLLCIALLPAAQAVQAEPRIRNMLIGMSRQGRPITAVQIGSGERKLVIVGDAHGGPEANTYQLTLQLIDYFRAHPEEVPPTVRLYLIPTINPDGLALNSRFDAAGVDLNRNMNTNLDACPENDWSHTVYGAYGIISDTGGPFPDSQLENRLLRNFLLDASGAIFLHSNAGLVFPAFCEHTPSIEMAQVYAEAAGYVYARYWPNYMISGGMHDWAGSMGIAAITPELLSATESEYPQNLAAVQAVLAQAERLLPPPQDREENGVVVPAVIWRYWRSHGGEEVFGLPLQPARATGAGLIQTFSRARLELRPALADTSFLVQPAQLAAEHLDKPELAPAALNYTVSAAPRHAATGVLTSSAHLEHVPLGTPELFFEETGYSLSEAFLGYWRRYGGAAVFGRPISEEFTTRTADGTQRIVQYFERAVFAYHPEDNRVRLEPLGWQALLRAQVQQPSVRPQVR